MQERLYPALILCLGAFGCSTLEPIGANLCGNGVTETESGESCDGQPGCEPPGSAMACHYSCTNDEECQKSICGEAPCENVWQCGGQGICQQASGGFEQASMILTGPVSNLRTSDLDANDHSELIVTGSRTMDLYGTPEPGAPLTSVARLTLDKRILTPPAMFSFDGDTSAFVGFGSYDPTFGGTLDIYAVDPATQTAEVRLYPNLQLALGEVERAVHLFVVDAIAPEPNPTAPPVPFPKTSNQQFVYLRGPIKPAIDPCGNASEGRASLVAYEDTAKIEGATPASGEPNPAGPAKCIATPSSSDLEVRAVGNFDESTSCDEIIIGHPAEAELTMYRLCRPSAGKAIEYNTIKPSETWLKPTKISLGQGARLPKLASPSKATAIEVVDLDGDGHLDIAFMATLPGNGDSGSAAVHVAYGSGSGTFASSEMHGGVFDNVTTTLAVDNSEPLTANTALASGDFDGDGKPEVRSACKECLVIATDIDGSGTLDFVVGERNKPGLLLHLGSGNGSFQTSMLDIPQPSHLHAADVDGDGFDDVLIAQKKMGANDEETGSTGLTVVYGGPSVLLTAPVFFATSTPILTMATGRLSGGDAASDTVFVLDSDAMLKHRRPGLMLGGNRNAMASPYVFDASYPMLPNADDTPRELLPGRSITARQIEAVNHSSGARLFMRTEPLSPIAGQDPLPDVGHAYGDLDDTSSSTNFPMLWMVPLSEGARIDSASIAVWEPETASSPFTDGPMALFNADGEGDDELLFFGSETLKVVKLTGDNQFDASTDRTLPHVFAKAADSPVVKRDMDRDGHVDLLLLDTTGRIVVLYGDASGLSDETTVLAADEPIRAFAALDADTDPYAEVAALTDQSLLVLNLDQRSQGDTLELQAQKMVDDMPPPDQSTSTASIATGDINRDGVDDIVCSPKGQGVWALFGKPVFETPQP